jgi:hypothetical protein
MRSATTSRTAAALLAIGLVAGACSAQAPSTPMTTHGVALVTLPPASTEPSPQPLATSTPPDATAPVSSGPTTEMWTATATYLEERAGESSTLLPNGSVLVAGGVPESQHLGSARRTAELYNPGTRKWTRTGRMNVGREGHAAVLLQNGEVLVVGGDSVVARHRATLSSAELYDPTTGVWTGVPPMAHARSAATATLLRDGRVLVAGGASTATDAALSSAELYNPVSRQWTSAGDMEAPRAYHTATLLPSGKVLVTGGGCCGAHATASAELYDPARGTWTATTPLGAARRHGSAILLDDGRVLVYGGDDYEIPQLTAELYDPATQSWVPTSSPPNDGPAARLQDGRVFVMGWWETPEIYDPATGSWASIERPSTLPHSFIHGPPPPTLLADGRVLVPDGRSAYVFDPAGAP